METELRTLTARLMANQALRRDDALVVRALTDEAFRQELEQRLKMSGLKFLENPYCDHVCLVLDRDMEQPVMGSGDAWLSNTLGLGRDGIALLMVLWALIILPKRQRQIERKTVDENQDELFADEKPLETGSSVSAPVSRNALIADFGELLGRKTRIDGNLSLLARNGFIVRQREMIYEGPLLDLVLDYNQLAERVLGGALQDLLGRDLAVSLNTEEANPDEEDLDV